MIFWGKRSSWFFCSFRIDSKHCSGIYYPIIFFCKYNILLYLISVTSVILTRDLRFAISFQVSMDAFWTRRDVDSTRTANAPLSRCRIVRRIDLSVDPQNRIEISRIRAHSWSQTFAGIRTVDPKLGLRKETKTASTFCTPARNRWILNFFFLLFQWS